MYAVIKTGGKQYRVQPGDLMVVEKLEGEPGAKLSFGDVLMLGDGDAITLGAPTVDGAAVAATLIETRKGDKIKVFKKTRRKGYRRTKGHRQHESVLRVIGISAGGKETKWDGKVDLTTKAELDARARNLAVRAEAPKKATKSKAVKADETLAAAEEPIVEVEAEAIAETKAPAKKAAAPKTEAKAAPAKPAAKAAAPKKAAAKAETTEKKAAPKKAAAKKDSDKA